MSRHRRSGLLRAPITARRRRRTPARGRVRSLQHRHTAKMVTRSRLAIGRRATNKRQTPAPIPPRLFAHMRCWVRRGVVTSHFVEWQGAPVKSVKTGFIGQARKGGRQATTRRRLSCTICGAHSARPVGHPRHFRLNAGIGDRACEARTSQGLRPYAYLDEKRFALDAWPRGCRRSLIRRRPTS